MKILTILLIVVGAGWGQTVVNPPDVTGGTCAAVGGDLSGTCAAATVVKVNGVSIPASAPLVGTNSSNQIILATPFATNAQSGTYQVLAADFASYKTIIVASGTFTITLVASGSQPATGQSIRVVNYGSGVVTIARSGQNINGGTSSLTLAAASATAPTSAWIVSNATDYFAESSSAGASPAGSLGDIQTYATSTTFGSITPGTGIAAALAVNVGSAGAPVLFNGALGTPSSGVATNITGLPAAAVVAGALANGMTVTTQSANDNSTKAASTAYVDVARAAYLPLAGGTLAGNLLFTDATYDIGASGATRPRNIFLTGGVSTGLGSGLAGFHDMSAGTAHTATGVGWQSPTSITNPCMFTMPGVNPAVGLLHLTNACPSVATVSPVVAADVSTSLKTLSCQPGLGDGVNAVAAASYLQSTCYNDTGATVTITGIKCFTDNNGTSTLAATNGAGTALLTGAVTCTNAFAAGTQSGTVTIASADYIKFTFAADGTSKQSTWVVTENK